MRKKKPAKSKKKFESPSFKIQTIHFIDFIDPSYLGYSSSSLPAFRL